MHTWVLHAKAGLVLQCRQSNRSENTSRLHMTLACMQGLYSDSSDT